MLFEGLRKNDGNNNDNDNNNNNNRIIKRIRKMLKVVIIQRINN